MPTTFHPDSVTFTAADYYMTPPVLRAAALHATAACRYIRHMPRRNIYATPALPPRSPYSLRFRLPRGPDAICYATRYFVTDMPADV